jgi:hypothetical protein
MNTSAFPSIDQFPQGMDFLKQFWAQGAGAAASAQASPTPAFQQAMGQYLLPTMDLPELDKRISDLRTVVQFMELNTAMLRQSLNALEVQRNTIATLQSMSQSSHPQTADPAAGWFDAWQNLIKQNVTNAAPPNATAKGSARKPTDDKAAPKKSRSKPKV